MARPEAENAGGRTMSTSRTVAVDNGRFSSANFANADIILQSSDNALFHVHRTNLSALSAFFRDMFHVGNPEMSPADEWIPVSEREEVVELLLQMCYPADDGTPPVDLAKVESKLMLDVYEAAVKYQMWVTGLALGSFVEPLISRDPFLIVNLAHRLNDSVMLQRAAAATLEIDILEDTPKLRAKTGALWPDILEYHFRTFSRVLAPVVNSAGRFGPRITGSCCCAKCSTVQQKMNDAVSIMQQSILIPRLAQVREWQEKIKQAKDAATCCSSEKALGDLPTKVAALDLTLLPFTSYSP